MFGVEERSAPSLRNHPLAWPAAVAVFGFLTLCVALFVFGSTGIVWFAPLFAGPSLMVLGIAGLFLPGVTGVIGFDWNGYENWQLYLGAGWLVATLVAPLSILAVLMVVSLMAG